MRILIAEDERITRASLTRQLEAWGHSVVAAEDGSRAWQAFATDRFDVVLTDWEMPGLSGLELIERVRSAREARGGGRAEGTGGEAPFVYVIMLTGRTDKADLVRGIEAGADDFVSKPFDKEELRVRLLAGERTVRLERRLSEQNNKMRADLLAASRVQRAMLPRGNLSTARASAAWTYVPTDELAGDAIGLSMVGEHYLAAYVIDVSGHGVPAALLSVTAMHSLPLDVLESGLLEDGKEEPRPERVLADLNRRFCASENSGLFLTMVLCVLDTRNGAVYIARAGHPLPIVIRAGGAAETVPEDGGLPIGLTPDADYPPARVTLDPGDRLCLFSDGFPEQPRAGEGKDVQYGEERLRASLSALAKEPGDRVVERAVDDLAAWAGGRRFVDDVSMVAIDYRGEGVE